MLDVVAGIAAPELRPWPEQPEGEHGLALENGGLVVFTRGNLVVVVASAGLEPIDVRPMARRVDAWLVGAGAEAAAPNSLGTPPGALWLRWNDDRGERRPGAMASVRRPMEPRPTVVTPRHGAAFSARQS